MIEDQDFTLFKSEFYFKYLVQILEGKKEVLLLSLCYQEGYGTEYRVEQLVPGPRRYKLRIRHHFKRKLDYSRCLAKVSRTFADGLKQIVNVEVRGAYFGVVLM